MIPWAVLVCMQDCPEDSDGYKIHLPNCEIGARVAERNNQSAPAEKSNDPNLAGSDATKPVKQERVALMSESCEYDQNEPYHKPRGVA